MMGFELDTLRPGVILLDGKPVGTHEFRDGKHVVTVTLTYETTDDVWFDLLNTVSHEIKVRGLVPPPPTISLEIDTTDDDVAEQFDVPQSLDEKTIKHGGYKWRFHKSDADPWPSLLHGHDYEKHKKLDALTGEIWDTGTRQLYQRLKDDKLAEVQAKLRASKDFVDRVDELLSKTPR